MKAGIEKWLSMKPVIESGIGNNRDYWADIDHKKGLSYSEGYQRIFEAFYGKESIRVEKIGDSYNIINGRHRIWLAKRMGIKELPINLVEKQ